MILVFVRIITERFYNIWIDESNNYLREEITENKVDEPLMSFQRDNQSKEDKQKIQYNWNFDLLCYFEKEIAKDL